VDKPLRPVPVLYACRGCEHDAFAREVAEALDRRGLGEAYVAGAEASRARARFPVYAIEGCEKACTKAWLAQVGVTAQRSFVLDASKSAESEAGRIAACLGGT
jgi:uncharacterized metal-binding protein